MKGTRAIGVAVRIAVVAIVLAGCASSFGPTSTPITSISQIEGTWRGTITMGFNGPQELYEITIHPDGTYVAQWAGNWQWGKVTLSGGAGSFEVTAPGASTGTVRYFAGQSRTLMFNSTFDNWSTNVKPAS